MKVVWVFLMVVVAAHLIEGQRRRPAQPPSSRARASLQPPRAPRMRPAPGRGRPGPPLPPPPGRGGPAGRGRGRGRGRYGDDSGGGDDVVMESDPCESRVPGIDEEEATTVEKELLSCLRACGKIDSLDCLRQCDLYQGDSPKEEENDDDGIDDGGDDGENFDGDGDY